MKFEELIEYFSLFGGIGEGLEEYYLDDTLSFICNDFIKAFSYFEQLVRPSYLLDSPYAELLMAIAQGDGKVNTALKKAKLSLSVGERILKELLELKIVSMEISRESPLKINPKQKIKKEYRNYKIQDKVRFNHPFLRFWFGFVQPYKKELSQHIKENFLQNFMQHHERLTSLVYEQLCNALLLEYQHNKAPLISSGSFWNIYSEFDILALTKERKIFLGECKYKERKVCKNELNKLKFKAIESGIKVNTFVLFSKIGFSNELLHYKERDKDILLFDLEDLKKLV